MREQNKFIFLVLLHCFLREPEARGRKPNEVYAKVNGCGTASFLLPAATTDTQFLFSRSASFFFFLGLVVCLVASLHVPS